MDVLDREWIDEDMRMGFVHVEWRFACFVHIGTCREVTVYIDHLGFNNKLFHSVYSMEAR